MFVKRYHLSPPPENKNLNAQARTRATYANIHTCATTHPHTRAHTCTPTNTLTHIHTYRIIKQLFLHIRTHIHTCTQARQHAYTHTHSHTHARTHAHTHTRTHAHTHTRTNERTHARTHTHTHTHTHTRCEVFSPRAQSQGCQTLQAGTSIHGLIFTIRAIWIRQAPASNVFYFKCFSVSGYLKNECITELLDPASGLIVVIGLQQAT